MGRLNQDINIQVTEFKLISAMVKLLNKANFSYFSIAKKRYLFTLFQINTHCLFICKYVIFLSQIETVNINKKE